MQKLRQKQDDRKRITALIITLNDKWLIDEPSVRNDTLL